MKNHLYDIFIINEINCFLDSEYKMAIEDENHIVAGMLNQIINN